MNDGEMQIRIEPHNPYWRTDFETEAGRIRNALENAVRSLHHIGSTAIPGIYAKPIIDMLLEVDDIVGLDSRQPAMERLEYEAMGEFGISGRRYFRKDNIDGIRRHQVHAFETGSPDVTRHLAFRDYMMAHPAAAQAYSDLKRRLVRQFPDGIEAYMEGKDPCIKEYEAEALAWWSQR